MVPYKDQSEVCKHAKPAKLVTIGDENIKSLDSEQLLHTAKSTFGDHNSSCAKSSYSIYRPKYGTRVVSPNFLPYCINITQMRCTQQKSRTVVTTYCAVSPPASLTRV